MERSICRIIGSALLASCILLVSACATTKPEEAVSNKTGEVTRETTRKATSNAGSSITRSTIRTEPATPGVQNKPAAQIGNVNSINQQFISARILQKVKLVNIRSAASDKTRIIARLHGGKQIDILEEKGNWLKIRWHDREKTWEGWLYKHYVEMTP